MHSHQITAALPSAIAQELTEAGTAAPVPVTRTGIPLADIVVTGLSIITTVITLAQAPSALEDVAHRLVAWRRHVALGHDPVVSVDAAGPNGRVSIRLTNTTSAEELAKTISLLLPRPGAVGSVQDTSIPPADN